MKKFILSIIAMASMAYGMENTHPSLPTVLVTLYQSRTHESHECHLTPQMLGNLLDGTATLRSPKMGRKHQKAETHHPVTEATFVVVDKHDNRRECGALATLLRARDGRNHSLSKDELKELQRMRRAFVIAYLNANSKQSDNQPPAAGTSEEESEGQSGGRRTPIVFSEDEDW